MNGEITNKNNMNILARFKPIKLFALDVDGVLTDGSLLVFNDGQMVRKMNIKDGYALQLAIRKGYHLLIISGGNSEAVKLRLEKLGVANVEMGITDKTTVLQKYMQQYGIVKEEVLYMGDDMPDRKVMQLAGLACCPSNAVAEIRDIAGYISPLKGGEGCVRDVIEKVLKLHGKWNDDDGIASK
ncbi:MAG TPA: HAD-IIIA family hydrolase [Ferruginibacter sp.]|nr:HAD-IIIA family hydrolase [Ferruginibacter sp.]HRE65240.1 HAD-IIIA family hydrolase [Ferruginibacter sp.]